MTLEKDPEVDEILAGIINMVNGRHVVEPIDKPQERNFKLEGEQRRLFLDRYLSVCIEGVGVDTDPVEYAPRIKREFEDFRLDYVIDSRKNGDLVVAQLISETTLAHLVVVVDGRISMLDNKVGTIDCNNAGYRGLKLGIKRYEVVERSARIAMSLE